jgi:hypothetical protein
MQREFRKQELFRRRQDEKVYPSLFLLWPIEQNRLISTLYKQKFNLHLCCEFPGQWHPITYDSGGTKPELGRYVIENPGDLVQELEPYLKWFLPKLKVVAGPLAKFYDWFVPGASAVAESVGKVTEKLSRRIHAITRHQ